MKKESLELLNEIDRGALSTKELEALFQWGRLKEDPEFIREIRQIAEDKAREKDYAAYTLAHKMYLYGAKYNFDDYMVACEWKRASGARFWLPRREVWEGKHRIATQIQEFIEDPKALYLGLSVPPGCGKTALIKFLLAYIAGKYPGSANMYCSYSDGMVRMMLDSLRAIMGDRYEYAHNDIFPGLPDLKISAEYNTLSYRADGDFPTIGLVSLGGSVTGRTRANKFLITDDLVRNAEMARSPERLEKLWDDYRNTLTTRMIGDDVKQIQLGTIWSVHDPISRMKEAHEGDPRYKFIAIPVWDENERSNFYFDHPDRYTPERIREIRSTIDAVEFSCLYMQRPVEKEGLVFPYDSLKYYNGVLPDGEPDNIFFVCDVAWGGGDSLSMPIAYQYGSAVYIADVVFNKGDKSVTKPIVLGRILAHKCKMGRFEANNGGDEYADDISRQLREKNYSCNITHKKASGKSGKLARIEQFSSDIREFYFLAPSVQSNEYKAFMREVTELSFTAKNKHDDAPDSLAMLAEYLRGGQKYITVAPRPF